ncbi:hypothetical protein GLOTRDRAFT_129738 [Gloeophyllum trabeum ATCC 11539]|uniref:Uncharacterized protein n=1 Tax=Gloeophyllum trabeum (strain ATCC 11539 / FP-39264 / Madison 617) TaxID=670483 RepID=S7RM49_GLOTA|nr:uncharacterized protein GLOTRDRAFT_129738 [Gloeophyllum trabeum ATCC 11539]EPQ55465.1 hypothetical protein GLOTRDRAFT_129738 [Gloeophyllum trabeum ATCC 11539]
MEIHSVPVLIDVPGGHVKTESDACVGMRRDSMGARHRMHMAATMKEACGVRLVSTSGQRASGHPKMHGANKRAPAGSNAGGLGFFDCTSQTHVVEPDTKRKAK